MSNTQRISEALHEALFNVTQCVKEVTQMGKALDSKNEASVMNRAFFSTAQDPQHEHKTKQLTTNKKVLETLQIKVENVQKIADLGQDAAGKVNSVK